MWWINFVLLIFIELQLTQNIQILERTDSLLKLSKGDLLDTGSFC